MSKKHDWMQDYPAHTPPLKPKELFRPKPNKANDSWRDLPALQGIHPALQKLYFYINNVFDPRKHDMPNTMFLEATHQLNTLLAESELKGRIEELKRIQPLITDEVNADVQQLMTIGEETISEVRNRIQQLTGSTKAQDE